MTDERNNNHAERERRIREAIRSAGDVRAGAAFRERLKQEFVDGTIPEAAPAQEQSRVRSLPPWWWILVPAAAAVLLFVLFWPTPSPTPTWAVQAVHGQGRVEINGRILTLDEPALVAEALGSGGQVRLIEGVALDLLLDDRLLLALGEGAEVTLPAPTGLDVSGPLIAEVSHGELSIKTGPGFPGMALRILTTEGRTEIVGTLVSVYKADDLTCVCVLEGTARIGADESRLEAIPQGMRKVMFGDGRPPMVTEIQPQHEAGLLEFQQRSRVVFPPRE